MSADDASGGHVRLNREPGSGHPDFARGPEGSTVSIALCTYRGREFLPEQVESYLRQTRLPDEVVAVDDASGDGTADLLRRLLADAPFSTRVQENDRNLGVAANFEKALRLCRGDIIFLSDQDDVWKPQKIERLVSALEADPGAGYAFSNASLIDAAGEPTGEDFWNAAHLTELLTEDFAPGRQARVLLDRAVAPGATTAFRSELLRYVIPIQRWWGHDWWITLVSSAAGRHGIVLEEQLIAYRVHEGQQVGITPPDSQESLLERYRSHRDTFHEELPYHRDRLARLLELRQRLGKRGFPRRAPLESVRWLHEKVAWQVQQLNHLRARLRARSAGGASGLATVWREVGAGRYREHSSGWLSVVADLLEMTTR